MSTGYSQPPPPNPGYYPPDARSQGQYPAYQTQLPQPPYSSQAYGNQAYPETAGAYPTHSSSYQDGLANAYSGVPPSSYGSLSGAPPYAAGYGHDRPPKRSHDFGSEYPRKRFSGQYTNPPYQQGPSQNMRPPSNYTPNHASPSSAPLYHATSPNHTYPPTPQYPPPPAQAHAGSPAAYSAPAYGYQYPGGAPQGSPTNGYAQSPYAAKAPEYIPGPHNQRYTGPPPPNSYSAPNQASYASHAQPSYQPPYQGPPPYPSQPVSSSEGYNPMTRSHRQDSGPLPPFAPDGQPQVDPYQYMPLEGEQPSATQGSGYDYTLPTERASDATFNFPRGQEGDSMGKSEELVGIMQALDAERFSWDGALHPLPNEPIDPNFSIGKAGIITQHYAEPIRYPLESSIEMDDQTRKNRPPVTAAFENILSKYFDESGKLRLDLPKSKDPLFNMPNARLHEYLSISNARLFLDAPDDDIDDEGDVMSGLENALNGTSATQTAVPSEREPEPEPELEAVPVQEPSKPKLDPETERMLAELGVSGNSVSSDSNPKPTPQSGTPEQPVEASYPPPPPVQEYREAQPEPRPEYRPEPPQEYDPAYHPEYRPPYTPERQPEYVPDRRHDYRPEYRPEYRPDDRPELRKYSRSPRSMSPPRSSPYPNGRRNSNGTAAGSDFGPAVSPSPPPPAMSAQDNPLKRKSTEDLDGNGSARRRKSRVKGADTGSIYGRRD